MADRYWVNGTGTWDGASTANWSATSGGSAGASAPTSADNVFFDRTGPYSVTLNGSRSCANWTVSVGVVTFVTGTSTSMTVNGNVSWTAGTVAFSGAGYVFAFSGAGTKTITTNNVTPPGNPVQFNTGTFNLGSAFTAGNITLGSSAILTTNNNALTVSGFFGTGTMNWGSSTVTASGGTIFSTGSSITLNAGSSQLNCTAQTVTLNATGTPALTYNNVAFTNTVAGTITINGANTFNTLSFAARTGGLGIGTVIFNANQTIATLTLNAGTAAAYRTFLRSDTIGTQRTLSVGTLTAGAADYDFQDIAITGAAAPIAPTRAGDCKGNSGITFPAAKTVYWRQGGSASWGISGNGSWSLISGGVQDPTAFPLAQDTAIFPAATFPVSGSTTTINAAYNIGTIDMSLRTSNTMTLAMGTNAILVFGNWINGTGITISGTGSLSFQGRGAQTITSAGRSFTQNVGANSPGGTVTLQDNFTTTTATQSGLSAGTFNANGYNYTAIGYSSNNTGVRTIAIGSGTWTLNGTGSPWNTPTITNLTVTGTGTISLTNASAKIFNGGGIQTYPTLNQGGTGTLTVTGSNKFAAITATAAGTVSLTSGTTTQVPLINTTGTATVAVNPTSTTATIRGSVRSSRATLTGPLVLGAA